ncbi:hypothetical protein GCM10007981_01110 [Thermocladium modestius]|uniref:Winged helix DNA-binding domain-containing protein n=1 Tax=Thermocladium modestius TaxID=62609 RepID=A0A830GRJ8_9CREN|nr:transcriptional regulator [Thermocladium modestius]GGP19039.1 hypothetical protein GCM10007981_01110 [Thermocladium modestius]
MLADKAKILILVYLYVYGSLSFTDLLNLLAERMSITKGNLDSHLRYMEKNGLIRRRKTLYAIYGKRTVYGITDKGRDELINLIDEINRLANIMKPGSAADHHGEGNEPIG